MSGQIATAVLLLGCVAVSPAAGKAKDLTADEIRRLKAGEAVVTSRVLADSGAVAARAMALVDATPAAIMKIVRASDKYHEFMPRVIESKMPESKGDEDVCFVKVDVPIVGEMSGSTKVKIDEPERGVLRRRWKGLDGSGSYRINEGSWRISPWKKDPKRSLVVYRIKVATKLAVPHTVVRIGQQRSLPKMMDAVRERVRTEAAK